ncbi:MAG TPA: tyrosine-type recombinase/integrase, partial [Savagea sp.]
LPSFFYEKELSLLFDSIDASSFKGMRDLALLELLYATGIRVSELTTIELKEIDLSYGILLVHGKGKKERYVPFGEYASQALYQYIEKARPYLLRKKQHQRLFVNMRGDPLTDRGVRHILNEVVKKSALTHPIYPHKIRHSFATHLLNQGADIRIVQELLGHENLSTTQVYTHVTTDRLKQIIDTAHPRA